MLLHGYALAQFTMMPWALQLAQEGWRCVLVDLRGHGKSSGKQIYYGLQEAHDLSQLLDQLAQAGQLREPVAAMGESYGAVMALRWQTAEPRLRAVVAITPYAGLSNAVLNLRTQYADWLPQALLRAGLKKLPAVLGTTAAELDTTTVLSRHPVCALFVAADGDKIAPAARGGAIVRAGRARQPVAGGPRQHARNGDVSFCGPGGAGIGVAAGGIKVNHGARERT